MTTSVEAIREGLSKLDPANDAHWTENGAPAMKAVEEAVGAQVTRKEVTAAAPEFTRENRVFPKGEGAQPEVKVEVLNSNDDEGKADDANADHGSQEPKPAPQPLGLNADDADKPDDGDVAQPTEPEPMVEGEPLPEEDPLALLQKELDGIQHELDRIRRVREQMLEEERKLNLRHQEISETLERSKPPRRFEEEIQPYFQHLKRVREGKVEESPKSALDASFAPRRGIGLSRPQFVAKKD
jgi:hypothetical protein